MKSLLSTLIFLASFTYGFTQFREVSKTLGIDHLHQNALLIGGGATFFDYNNDGFIDLYVTSGGEVDRLYKNIGDGSFLDVSLSSNITEIVSARLTSAVVSGDINNDGCLDLFITTMDDTQNLLLLNNCEGLFTNISKSANITEISNSTGATFIDVNNDSYLDIYVINYINKSQFFTNENNDVIGFDHECFPNYLYINNGDDSFVESAVKYGVEDVGCGLAVAATDLNNDGNLDLYVVNDFGEWIRPNAAYINNYPLESFQSSPFNGSLDISLYGMGIAIGDINNDLKSDYYVTNIGSNKLMIDVNDTSYQDFATLLKVDNKSTVQNKNVTSWGALCIDVDNDSDLDIFVSNGFISSSDFLNTDPLAPNKLFLNNIDSFVDQSTFWKVESEFTNRGAIYGDYDNDGDLDIFCVTVDGRNNSDLHSLFYENESSGANNWNQFLLEGVTINRDAYGAKLIVYTGNETRLVESHAGGSYASQSSKILHVGLGNFKKIDSLTIKWNATEHEKYYDLPVNQSLYIKQGTSELEVLGCMEQKNPMYNNLATKNSGCFETPKIGCMDILSINYDPEAVISDESCIYEKILSSFSDREQVDIGPNPFNNYLKIKVTQNDKDYEYNIVSLGGYVLGQGYIHEGDQYIDTSNFDCGIYVLQLINLKDTDKIENFKLLKY